MGDFSSEDMLAIAAEHGGVPAFVPDGDDFAFVVLTIERDALGPGSLSLKIDDEDIEIVVRRADLERLLEGA